MPPAKSAIRPCAGSGDKPKTFVGILCTDRIRVQPNRAAAGPKRGRVHFSLDSECSPIQTWLPASVRLRPHSDASDSRPAELRRSSPGTTPPFRSVHKALGRAMQGAARPPYTGMWAPLDASPQPPPRAASRARGGLVCAGHRGAASTCGATALRTMRLTRWSKSAGNPQ